MALRLISYLLALAAPMVAPATRLSGTKRMLLRGSSIASDGETTLVVDDTEACADLTNKATHFTVQVNVGTPPQSFELVADTGSDALIVTSCVCVDSGFCPHEDKCFRGTNHSSTFAVKGMSSGGPHELSRNESGPLGIRMTFGSGTVTSIIASEVAQVGGLKAQLDDGLLLMVDRRELAVNGDFQGILGLGPAPNLTAHPNITMSQSGHQLGMHPQTPPGSLAYTTKLFLKEAGVSRFSMCFNDAGKPGAMRLNVPAFKNPLPAIGSFHWGLGLYGMSVGSKSAEAVLCQAGKMKDGQKTPCGAIPDSGTTLMMGPKDQVEQLFGSLCDNWERCRKARVDTMSNLSASHAFQTLLYGCDSWLTNGTGINEVPSVFLKVGAGDTTQTLEITPWAYITESVQAEYKHVTKHLFGVIPVIVDEPTGKSMKVCSPSFGVTDYNTVENGPVWILGTPLFYQFTVGYDLSGPTIDFSEQKCGGCNETASLLSSQVSPQAEQTYSARRIRSMAGLPRVRHFDTNLPM